MKFLIQNGKFDVCLIALMFLIVFAAWIYTRDRDALLLLRDLLIALFAIVGVRRASEIAASTTTGDVMLNPAADPPADAPGEPGKEKGNENITLGP